MRHASAAQRELCDRHGVPFTPPEPGERVGIALQTLGRKPLHGVRVEPEGGVCGWYLWAGEVWSDDADFYQPPCVEHLAHRCPEALPFLALPGVAVPDGRRPCGRLVRAGRVR
jgi:hypothetical protein